MGTQKPYRFSFEQYVQEARTKMPTRKAAGIQNIYNTFWRYYTVTCKIPVHVIKTITVILLWELKKKKNKQKKN